MNRLFALALFISMSAHAGGDDSGLDPYNGCFEILGYDGSEIAKDQADFVNNRSKYLLIKDRDRFNTMKRCWEDRAKCVQVKVICRVDGKEVYKGQVWFWR